MPTSSYFRTFDARNEQELLHSLVTESIQIHGHDVSYIPRTLVNTDTILGEDSISEFKDSYSVEMFIKSVDGFEGEGDIISRFGLEIRDRMSLVVSKKRFQNEVGVYENITRPKEGDLIYFPLSKTLFEINFVEHENPFYQHGKLHTYVLSCEVFTYSQEEIDTGYTAIDVVEEERKKFAIELDLGTRHSSTSYVNFFEGETVYQVSGVTGGSATLAAATATAVATDWDSATTKLTITNVVGSLSTTTGETIKGAVSGAEYEISTKTTTTIIIPHETEDNKPMGDNEDLELFRDQDDIFDFTDTDPFSEGNY